MTYPTKSARQRPHALILSHCYAGLNDTEPLGELRAIPAHTRKTRVVAGDGVLYIEDVLRQLTESEELRGYSVEFRR